MLYPLSYEGGATTEWAGELAVQIVPPRPRGVSAVRQQQAIGR
jgi:hypothetical protein